MGGIQGRLYRISFSGERAYEIAVPARWGEALAARLAEAGALPYGLEALNVMRVEKGHITHAEIDGRVTARDLGFGRMMSTKKDYIGRQMAQRPALLDPDRPALVGLKPVDRAVRIRAGGHFVAPGVEAKASTAEGHVSSVAYSPDLGTWIGLGFLKNGPQRHGARLRLVDQVRGTDTLVEIVSPMFLDPEGERLRG
jgi:sarcosine oxidase subunit alpha